MAFIPLPNGIKICFRYHLDGQQVCNVFYATSTEPHTPAYFASLGLALVGWWTANVQANLSGSVSLDAIEITDATTAGGVGIEYTTGLPLTGSHGGDVLPSNVTYAIKLSTGLTGRSHRGRQYWPAITATQKDTQNHVTSTFRTAVVAAYNALVTILVDETAQLVVASFFSGGLPRTTGVATPVVAALTTDDVVDSQRRRLPGRGS